MYDDFDSELERISAKIVKDLKTLYNIDMSVEKIPTENNIYRIVAVQEKNVLVLRICKLKSIDDFKDFLAEQSKDKIFSDYINRQFN